MPQLTDSDKKYIADNWAKKSCSEIAKRLGVNKTSVFRAGKRMGLGEKPDPKAVTRGERHRKRETVRTDNSPQTDFFSMIDSVFSQLVDERTALLDRLTQLAKLPSDERGQVALEVGSTTDRLNKIEAALIDAEELVEASRKYRPKKPSPTDELTTLDEMIEHLNTPEARKEEGRITEKVKIAAERVTHDWQHNLFAYEDGSVDVVMLTPEGVLKEGA